MNGMNSKRVTSNQCTVTRKTVNCKLPNTVRAMLIGLGYDIHQLREGRKLVLGGVEIPHTKGLFGHSDGDVVVHSVCDAILGAMGEEDIGKHFPDNDTKYKDIYSVKLLEEVLKIMKAGNLSVNNLDITIVAQEPKVSPYKKQIKQKINL